MFPTLSVTLVQVSDFVESLRATTTRFPLPVDVTVWDTVEPVPAVPVVSCTAANAASMRGESARRRSAARQRRRFTARTTQQIAGRSRGCSPLPRWRATARTSSPKES